MMRALTEWLARFWGTLRGRRTDSDLEQELRSHIDLASEANRRRGLTPGEARRAATLQEGAIPQTMETLRDQRGLPWLHALTSDVVFGWRRLRKSPRSTAVTVLSLALAIGAMLAAFRLIDAVLLRPLPARDPGSLFALTKTGLQTEHWGSRFNFAYPNYREYAQLLGTDADVMVLGMVSQVSIRVPAGGETESVNRQFVSGSVFTSFGLTPALGRLIAPDDDRAGTNQVAVLGHHFWKRRFGGDERVLGTTLQYGSDRLEIVGVAPAGFTGTEPGIVADIFLPATLNRRALENRGWIWFQMWLRPRGAATPAQLEQRLQAMFHNELLEEAKSFPAGYPKARLDAFLSETLQLVPAGAGVSELQKTYRQPLVLLNVLAGLVLLMACVNVASTLIAQSIERRKEMALRVSIGATRGRLVRMLLVECAMLASIASTLAVLFSSWAAPFVASMIQTVDRPVQLGFGFDWRVLAYSVSLTAVVTILFGLIPALVASATRPVGALKADRPYDPHRMTSALVAGQMAFSFVVLFVAGLFVMSFTRLSTRPLGFSAGRVLVVEVDSPQQHQPQIWAEVLKQLRETSGVESASMAGWAPLTGNAWNGTVRGTNDTEPSDAFFLDVTAGYFESLGIAMREGRDFLPHDVTPGLDDQKRPVAGHGIVNEAFSRRHFGGESPVGRRVTLGAGANGIPLEIVGLVANAAYLTVRETLRPTVYVPIAARDSGTFFVRTAADPSAASEALRKRIPEIRPDLRVRRTQPLEQLVTRQLVRERALAMLSLFFAAVALLLAGIGLSGVVNGAVLRQRREIGIRLALGAPRPQIIRRVVARIGVAALVGCGVGLAIGIALGSLAADLLFAVRSTDAWTMLIPTLVLALAATLAALPPVVRAVRTNLVGALKEEAPS